MATSIPLQVSRFLDYKVVERGIAEPTRQSYHAALCEFCSFLGHDSTQTTEAEIKRYLSSRNCAPRTVAHRVSVLREFFKFLQIEGLIHQNPMERIESPKQWKTVPRYMSEIEVHNLIEAPASDKTPYRHAMAYVIAPSAKSSMPAGSGYPSSLRRDCVI
jgi:integrase/recombinase XerD